MGYRKKSRKAGVVFGSLRDDTVHLCIDMQNLLTRPESPWKTEWAETVLPRILQLVEHAPEKTVFTRFMPPVAATDMPGSWQRYFQIWSELTQAKVDPELLALHPALHRLVPPAMVFDKPVYSAFSGWKLQQYLQTRHCTCVVVSGAETDVCVLATVLGAVDHGYRVILAADAVCGSQDRTHDALLEFYRSRLPHQMEIATTDEILSAWPDTRRNN